MTEPNFDRFRAAVTRERLPDRLPCIELHVDMEMMAAFLGRPIATMRDYVAFWKTAGYDYCMLSVMGQPLPDSFQQFKVGQIPRGEGSGEYSSSTFDVPTGVKDWKTFEEYPWVGPEDAYYGDVDAMERLLPDGMKLVVNQGPLFSGIWRMMGLEAFSFACREAADLVKAISAKIGETCVDIARDIVQRDCVGAYWIGDDMGYTNGLMVRPDFLREHVFPYYRRIGDLCRQHDKPLLLHSDGRIVDVFEDLIACGVQAVHPNEPTSVDVVELKRDYGDRLSFVGAMDVDVMTRGSVDDVVTAVRRLIDTVAPGGGFAPGGGNSITKHVPLANYRALLDTVRDCGDIY